MWAEGGNGEGGDVGGSGGEGVERPGSDVVWMATVGEEAGGGVGVHGDVEMVEGERDAGPQRFDVGFLAGPSGEKRGGALAFGQGEKGRVFVCREELFHEPGVVLRREHLFHVDADRMVAGHGDEGEVAGVGEVKLEPGVVGRGEGGFAVGSGRESQLAGGKVQVAAEDVAQCAVGGDEAFAVFGEAEACGAGALVRRKRGVEPVAARGGDLQGCLPNVHVVV